MRKELRAVFKETGGIDAASILLNLTDYRVIYATQHPEGREVLIKRIATEAACPSCGLLTTRVQSRLVHRVKGLPPAATTCRFRYASVE